MSSIIAGDPAPTNPTARAELLMLDGSDEWPAQVDRVLTRLRAEVLAEAIEAVLSERVTNALFGSDIAHNHGIADAVAAITRLFKAGESRG
ncbi:hypothetical protein ACIBEA_30145 [Streptomyces sp. NPDC051555]|uniref:hypothetical protein n=1 Tax=Streptomyces sp. NPDC051555 TaxID=3365657 RepID=UPI0037BBE593